MYPIRFVLEPQRRLVAQHGVAVHVADVVVDDQVKHGQVEQSLKKLTFSLWHHVSSRVTFPKYKFI